MIARRRSSELTVESEDRPVSHLPDHVALWRSRRIRCSPSTGARRNRTPLVALVTTTRKRWPSSLCQTLPNYGQQILPAVGFCILAPAQRLQAKVGLAKENPLSPFAPSFSFVNACLRRTTIIPPALPSLASLAVVSPHYPQPILYSPGNSS